MKKTVLEWYETFPEPYRSQAIENTSKENLKLECLFEVLESSDYTFWWLDSPQGKEYWNTFFDNLKQKP
jgi:hypothetical protein